MSIKISVVDNSTMSDSDDANSVHVCDTYLNDVTQFIKYIVSNAKFNDKSAECVTHNKYVFYSPDKSDVWIVREIMIGKHGYNGCHTLYSNWNDIDGYCISLPALLNSKCKVSYVPSEPYIDNDADLNFLLKNINKVYVTVCPFSGAAVDIMKSDV